MEDLTEQDMFIIFQEWNQMRIVMRIKKMNIIYYLEKCMNGLRI